MRNESLVAQLQHGSAELPKAQQGVELLVEDDVAQAMRGGMAGCDGPAGDHGEFAQRLRRFDQEAVHGFPADLATDHQVVLVRIRTAGRQITRCWLSVTTQVSAWTRNGTNEQAKIRDERRGMVMVSYRVRKSVAVNIGRKNAAAGKQEWGGTYFGHEEPFAMARRLTPGTPIVQKIG